MRKTSNADASAAGTSAQNEAQCQGHANEQEQCGDVPGVTHETVRAAIDHALMPLGLDAHTGSKKGFTACAQPVTAMPASTAM